jgi:sulfite exporter TauE/SafE/copper chaperone CopZ
MNMANEVAKFTVEGMNCKSCETVIKKVAESMSGVARIEVDYDNGSGTVEYDPAKTNLKDIFGRISENGFDCRLPGEKKGSLFSAVLSLLLVLIGVYLISGDFFDVPLPALDQDTSLLLVFALGLVTGFHCIAMCGGFVVSYSSKDASGAGKGAASHIVYGLAKTLSYTFFGGLFGLLGSFITFTPQLRGLVAAVAGVFLILFGLNMLGIFSFRIPGSSALSRFSGKRSNSPLVLGLLNGLMFACGPLQAMYVMAAASGSALYGALYLGIFGLGTLPMLLGFGFLTSIISSRMTRKILRYSGVIVIILGIVMLNRGMLLTGSGYDLNTLFGSKSPGGTVLPTNETGTGALVQVIRMNVTRYGWEPNTFVLKKGVPVKWVINGKELTGCNNAIQVPKLGLEFKIKLGEQTIEFTPNEAGVIPWSCWMGMIDGKFIVEDGGQ